MTQDPGKGLEIQKQLFDTMLKFYRRSPPRSPIIADVLSDPEAYGYQNPFRIELMKCVYQALKHQGADGSRNGKRIMNQLFEQIIRKKAESELF